MSLRRVPVVLRSSTLALRQRSTLPQTLVLFVTSRCNARCDFCLYKDSVDNPTRRSEELTLAEVRRIAEQYGPLHYLAMSGGEPFVRRDIGQRRVPAPPAGMTAYRSEIGSLTPAGYRPRRRQVALRIHARRALGSP